MARPRTRIPLTIYINREKVGSLYFSSTGQMQLTYDISWIQSENGRPLSLSLPLGHHPLSGRIVENFFDNLLPDNNDIRRRIQARFGASSDKCFDLLQQIGRECVGAIQLMPETEKPPEKEIDAKKIKMAMAVDGKNKHYYWNEIVNRHFSTMAQKSRFPEEELQTVFHELLGQMEEVIGRVTSYLSTGFPSGIAESVFNGMRAAKERLGI